MAKVFVRQSRGTKAHTDRLRQKTWGEDPLFEYPAGGYNKNNYFGFEKFSLEEKRFLPIIICEQSARRALIFGKQFVRKFARTLELKFTLPTLV